MLSQENQLRTVDRGHDNVNLDKQCSLEKGGGLPGNRLVSVENARPRPAAHGSSGTGLPVAIA